MILLDANVLIGFLDQSDDHHERALELLEEHDWDEFATSVLTVAEVLVHPTKAGTQDAAMAALHRIGVQLLPVDPGAALEIARVRSMYRVRMPDAVVLHSALEARASVATFDKGLAAAARQAGLTALGLPA